MIRRRLAACGAVALLGAGAFVATAPAAGAADLGGGVVTGMEIDGNKTVEGASPAFDWAHFQPSPLVSGPTGTIPGYVIDGGAGIVSAGVVQSNYTIDGATLATACGQGTDSTPITGKLNDNPWNTSTPANVAGKDDICSGGNALEVVNVNGQVHYILYTYYTRTPTASGDESVLQVLYGANPGRCDDVIVNVDFNPSSGVTFLLYTWQPTANDGCANPNGPGTWVAAAPTPAQLAAFEGASGQNPELVDPRGQDTFGETAIDLTVLGPTVASGIIPENGCVSFTTGPLITYTGNDTQSSLKDILNLAPITIDNCSEISITKATSPAGVTGGPFNYTLDQTDAKWVHDATLAETNGLGQLPQLDPLKITSNINAGDTHHWVDVIAQPDYRLAENSLPAGWTLAQIACTFYDPFFVVNGVVVPQQRTLTATFQAATSGTLSGFAIPPAMLDNGVKTSCTITNATSAVKIVKAGNGAPGQPFTFTATDQAATQLHIGDSVTYAYAPGTAFTVTETLPATTPAWVLSTLACVDPLGLPGDLNLDVPNKTISATTQAGHLLTCTFFNNQNAGLTVTKMATGVAADYAWGPFDFTLSSSDGGTFTGNATQSISGTGLTEGIPVAGWADLVAGKHYTIAETGVADWTSTITCTGITDADPATDGFQFVAVAGQVLACTATNAAAPGAVTLTKSVSGVDPSLAWGPFDFTISGDAFTGNATQSISGTGSGTGATTANWGGLVAGGTYTITETLVPGFVTVLSCTDVVDQDETADNSVTFTAALGQQISCSATNRAVPASLRLDKSASAVADGFAWGPFDFTLAGGPFAGAATQSISGTGNGVSASTASWTALLPGATYTLTETPGPGWASTIVCNVPDTDPAAGVFTFVAPLGTEVSCSAFNVAQPGSVSVTKDVTGNATDSAWSFDFSLSPTDGVPEAATQTISGTGPATGAGPAAWSNLLPGVTYTLTETAVAGWDATITCGGLADADGQTAGFQFQALPGMALSCTATNAQKPIDLALDKSDGGAFPLAGTSFAYTLTITNAGTNNPLSSDPITVTDVLPAGLTAGALPAGCSISGQTITCDIAPSALAVGAAPVVITIPVTVAAGASGTVTNKAWVSTRLDLACTGAGCLPACPGTVATGQILGAVAANNTDCEDTPIQLVPSTLPATGTNSMHGVNIALLLTIGGIFLVVVRRRLGNPAG